MRITKKSSLTAEFKAQLLAQRADRAHIAKQPLNIQ
jgi:hypothetical protein